MRLGDWLERTGTKQGDLASGVGVTQGRISQLLKGDLPSLALAQKIQAFTGGQVTPNDYGVPEVTQ